MELAYTPPLQSASFSCKSSLSLSLVSSSRYLSLSLSLSLSLLHFPPLFLFPSFLFISSLLPVGPGIPSCGCKIDGVSRDNCCSGTRFQTRVHLEYTRRKALPTVMREKAAEGRRGEEKERARSDFSFAKREILWARHGLLSFANMAPRAPADTRRVLQEISRHMAANICRDERRC